MEYDLVQVVGQYYWHKNLSFVFYVVEHVTNNTYNVMIVLYDKYNPKNRFMVFSEAYNNLYKVGTILKVDMLVLWPNIINLSDLC